MSANDLRLTQIPSVKVGMLIRRPPGQVFRAFVDPTLTTRFWFTKSSGRLVPGANVQWDWEMYGVSANVFVKEIEEDSRILMQWGDSDESTTVEWRFTPWEDDSTYLEVTETGHSGNGDELASRAAESTRLLPGPVRGEGAARARHRPDRRPRSFPERSRALTRLTGAARGELVEVRAKASERWYGLRAEPLAEVGAWLEPDRMYGSTRLDALERHLDERKNP